MAGLPHFRNSTAAINNFEPLYSAHFEVILTPPAAVGAFDLVMENLTKVGGLDTNKMPETVTQKYKMATRTFAGGAVGETSVTLTLDFEVNLNNSNSAYVYKAFRRWSDLIYDPLTGRMGLKRDYTGGPMVISQFNKNGDIFHQWKFPTVFMSKPLPGRDLDFSENGIFKLDGLEFVADFWEETIL